MTVDNFALEGRGLTKHFGATKALDKANFSVRAGTAHALLGENGAGKSTTIKLLSGLLRPDAGTIQINGKNVLLGEPSDAHRHGLQTAFQELTLAPDLSVTQNMMLAYEPTGFLGQINNKMARQLVAEHFESIQLTDIDLRANIRTLGLSQRQKIEIARALIRNPKILLLDEATSALSGKDIEWLAGIIERLKQQGVTIVMITHKMTEVREFCEYVTVLRNGKDVGAFETKEVSDDALVELIIGRSLEATFPPKGKIAKNAKSLLSVEGLATERGLSDCSFELRQGEILGLAGLQGMGQNELLNSLFGIVPTTSGKIKLEGEPVQLGSPGQAIDMRLALVPEDRKTEGLFLELTGRENIAAPVLDRMSRFGVVDKQLENKAVASMMRTVQVHERALFTRAASFSGGNQQKIVLAKWLLTDPKILLLFDPCRGVDVGTKHEIYLLIKDFAESGGAVLLYSSETPELVNLCHRVLVLYEGRVADTLPRGKEKITEKSIMHAALGNRKENRSQKGKTKLQAGKTK